MCCSAPIGNNISALEALIDNGLDLNQKISKYHINVLSFAIIKDSYKIFCYLLQKDIDTDLILAALNYAVESTDSVGVFKVLLEKLGTTTNNDETLKQEKIDEALIIAMKYSNTELVQFLLEKGANPLIQNDQSNINTESDIDYDFGPGDDLSSDTESTLGGMVENTE